MKAKEVNEMTLDELNVKLDELKKELFGLRFSHTSGQLTNTMKISACKKDIARVKTILRQRELAAAKKA